jgi:hypothetical protein
MRADGWKGWTAVLAAFARAANTATGAPTVPTPTPFRAASQAGGCATSADLNDHLAGLQVLDPRSANGLYVYGVRWNVADGPGYLTLDEALESNALKVREISEAGQVPTLQVHNEGGTRVFLMAGEELVGAKQNRVLDVSVMVAEEADLGIPVSCVERGRWFYRSRCFGSCGTSSHSHLRHLISSQVHHSYRTHGIAASDQGAVWAEIERKLAELGHASPTHALHEAYESREVVLNHTLDCLGAPRGCCGAAFAFGGEVRGMDLFDRPETLAKLWPKLIRSYAIDALGFSNPGGSLPRAAEVETLFRSAVSAQVDVFKSPGLGEDLRLESQDLLGAALMVDRRPIHLELFRQLVGEPHDLQTDQAGTHRSEAAGPVDNSLNSED